MTQVTWLHNNQIRINGANPSCDGIDIGGSDGSNICIVHYDEFEGGRKECREKANLIAAAPELLRVLERFAQAMEQGSYPELQGVACEAFATLAKAKGLK